MKTKLLSTSVEELNKKFKGNNNQFDEILNLKIKMSSLIRLHRQLSEMTNKELAKILEIDESNLSKIIIAKVETLNKISIDSLLKHLIKLRPYSKEIDRYCLGFFKIV